MSNSIADYMRDKIAGLESQNDALRKQLSDQASEISMLNAEAEMWQQRAEMAEREVARVNERLAAAERTARLCHKHIFCLKNDAQREYDLHPTDYNCQHDWIELCDLLELIETMPPMPNPKEAERE